MKRVLMTGICILFATSLLGQREGAIDDNSFISDCEIFVDIFGEDCPDEEIIVDTGDGREPIDGGDLDTCAQEMLDLQALVGVGGCYAVQVVAGNYEILTQYSQPYLDSYLQSIGVCKPTRLSYRTTVWGVDYYGLQVIAGDYNEALNLQSQFRAGQFTTAESQRIGFDFSNTFVVSCAN